MTRTLELPEQVYAALVEAARSGGVAPSEWIASRLPRPERPPASEADRDEEKRRRLLRAAGGWAGDDEEGLDQYLEWSRRQRQVLRPEIEE